MDIQQYLAKFDFQYTLKCHFASCLIPSVTSFVSMWREHELFLCWGAKQIHLDEYELPPNFLKVTRVDV